MSCLCICVDCLFFKLLTERSKVKPTSKWELPSFGTQLKLRPLSHRPGQTRFPDPFLCLLLFCFMWCQSKNLGTGTTSTVSTRAPVLSTGTGLKTILSAPALFPLPPPKNGRHLRTNEETIAPNNVLFRSVPGN